MEKKRSVGVMVLSWVIIVSNLIIILLKIGLLSNVFSVVGYEKILWVEWIAISPAFDNMFDIHPATSFTFDGIWALVLLVCGVGLLRLNNIARVGFISLSLINTIVFYSSFYLGILTLQGVDWAEKMKHLPSPFTLTPFPLVVVLIYVIYLTRPKVKEQFK